MKKRKITTFIILILVLYFMGNTISICAYSTKDESCQADVAIVLGAAAYDDTVSPVYQERLNHGIQLYQQGYIKKIIVSDPLHMKRAMLLAEDTGIKAYSSPTPTTMYRSLKTKIPFLAREVFYYIGYQWCRILE